MLSERENQLVTRIGPGTAMGELYRRFWLPILLAEELAAPDCTPVRAQVLGERLVAFRDSAGRIGVLDERCPHRMASLFWGRNEEGGLRCAYHGWKWDVEGRCLDVPNTPEGESYRDKVTAYAAYPAVEMGGLVWAYMGPPEQKPELPSFELNAVPAANRYISKMFINGNWMQGLEGDIDSSHVSFLHGRVDSTAAELTRMGRMETAMFEDKAPRWSFKETGYGIMLAAQRTGPADTLYWRVNQWLMPSFTMIAARPGTPIHFQVRVPVDDEHQLYFRIIWHPDRALTDSELYVARNAGVNFPEIIPGTFQPKERRENNYLIDRALQKSGSSFTGIKSIPAQDWAMQEDQGGPIADRSIEHLVSADGAIIQVRQRLLKTLRELQEGIDPTEPVAESESRVRPIDIVLSKDVDVWEGAADYLSAKVWGEGAT
jgi:phenylpropionate dioxygenase-like ring-hydroxylating dioxygenase large terminal subunit